MRVTKYEIALLFEFGHGFKTGSTACHALNWFRRECCRGLLFEAVTVQTVLCDSFFQELHKYKTVRCATALITIHKRLDSDGSLSLMN